MEPSQEMDLKKFYAEGTADYLKTRIKKNERLLKINQYLSFALPLLVGGYAAIDHSSKYFELLVWGTGILSVIVLLSNLYTLVVKTDENLSRYLESYSFNKLLTDLYGELSSMSKSKIENQEPAKHIFSILKSKDDFNSKEDEKYVSNDDKKRIMFDISVKKNKACVRCNEIPTKFNKKKGCTNCGNYVK
ncbi:TPA: mobilome CxxCx(11)CxxC protein [Serratia fonticola]